MSQYFLSCMECALSIEIEQDGRLNFDMSLALCEELPGCFLLMHRGHALVFTTKE